MVMESSVSKSGYRKILLEINPFIGPVYSFLNV